MLKKTLIILSVVIVLIAAISLILINANENKIIIDDAVCPTVCVEMWVIQGNTCVFDECGSGCGPDKVSTFNTQEECIENIN